MSNQDEFYSFEKALDELRLKEEELKRLVSEGEIRAFREGETMKLRRSDVENLRSELAGGEVVDLGSASEELVFEDDPELDEAGMATEEISEADTILEDDIEDVGEVELEDEAPAAAAAPRVRATPRRAQQEEPETEGGLVLGAMMLSAVVLILAIPLCLDLASDGMSGFSKKLMGMIPGVDAPGTSTSTTAN